MSSKSSPKLYDRLSEFLTQYGLTPPFSERFSYFLCNVLRRDYGYVAMSPEELLLRGHLEPYSGFIVRSIDQSQHRMMFEKMGLTSEQFEDALNNCIMAGVLIKGSESDGQADFRTTIWIDSKVSFERALILVG